jgi:hypothetical protein
VPKIANATSICGVNHFDVLEIMRSMAQRSNTLALPMSPLARKVTTASNRRYMESSDQSE